MSKVEPKATIDFSKVLKNIKGEVIKDMIDPPVGMKQDNAPNLTLGSLFVHALTIGTNSPNMKESLKILRIAQHIEIGMGKDGKVEYTEGTLSQLEEAIAKVEHPMFKTPIYGGQMMESIETAKLEILRSKHNEKTRTD